MRPLRGVGWACAMAFMAAGDNMAHAAWDNVFQVTCFGRRNRQPAVSYYAPAACCPPAPCPQQTCTTRYVQRCYYQPVTSYQTKTYYEPVTTYRTSYYYEPVTSYRYSCYYDPCTCSYQQVACPTTSYRLRSQSCPVTSYLQRTCQVAVTNYQQMTYYEPVTTCSTYIPPPCTPPPPCNGAPGFSEQRIPPTPGIGESREGGSPGTGGAGDRISPQPNLQRYEGSRLRLLPPQVPAPSKPIITPGPPPTVKLDRVVALPRTNLEGEVIRHDNAPQAGARILFVNAEQQGTQQVVTANTTGQFSVQLASGKWLVYVTGADGKQVFDRKIDVGPDAQHVRLTSR